MDYRAAHRALIALANPAKAAFLQRFFKTGRGEYAEGDRFLGIMVPAVRRLAAGFRELQLPDIEHLLGSPYNEERLLALLIMVDRYRRATSKTQSALVRCYLRHRDRVNNWNLVDLSAPAMLGSHLLRRDRAILYRLVKSKILWDRRIAVLATFAFIREGDFADTLALTRTLLADPHDLMHKACGWALREVGKHNRSVLEQFLNEHCDTMPRTMLRYAIERLPANRRRYFLLKPACPKRERTLPSALRN